LHEYVIKYVALIVPSKFASGYMDDYNGYADDYDDARDFGDARDDYYDDYFLTFLFSPCTQPYSCD